MKIKTTFFTLFIICSISAFSQYMPIPEKNAVWSVWDEKYFTDGDTTINALDYVKIFRLTRDTTTVLDGFLRNDSANKRVYYLQNFSWATDTLLYDFSLDTGDVVSVASVFGTSSVKVIAKETTVINGVSRTVLEMDAAGSGNSWHKEYWIEGIGSTMGLPYSGIVGTTISDITYPRLLCFEKDSVNLYQDSTYQSCFQKWPASGLEEEDVSPFIILYPNPVQAFVKVQSELPVVKYKLYNMLGKEIETKDSINNVQLKINLSGLANGVYYLKLFTERGVALKKILKE